MNPTVKHIEIGLADGKPAVTLHLDNSTAQTIIFTIATAQKLSWNLLSLCERLTPPGVPGDSASVSDGCSVGIQPPKED